MGDQSVFYITTVSAFIALFATIFQGYFSSNELKHLTLILSSLTDLEHSNRSQLAASAPRVAVGYGACTDVYLNAVEFLNFTNYMPNGVVEALPSDKITNEQELMQTFAYFFTKGAAAE